MIWNNEFSLADMISIAMLAATFVTILLVFVQRHDAAKPIVIIRSTSSYKQIKLEDENTIFETSLFSVNCFGNCLAKDINIESFTVLSKPKNAFGFFKNDGEFLGIKPKMVNFSLGKKCKTSILMLLTTVNLSILEGFIPAQ